MKELSRRGMLIILSSPSGAGKTTLARRLVEWDSTITFSISATTRCPRDGEVNGREYFFKTHDEFHSMVRNGDLLEHAQVFGHLYGSPKMPVEQAIETSRDIIFDIDWQGGKQICDSVHAGDTVSIFVLPPSIAELDRRLRARAKDSTEMINARMAHSRDEISHWLAYDYVLVNLNIDRVLEKIKSIVTAERLKRERQTKLDEFVMQLNREFEAREQ